MKLLSLFTALLFTSSAFAHGKGFCISPEGAETLVKIKLASNTDFTNSYMANEGSSSLEDFFPLRKDQNNYFSLTRYSFSISDGNYGSGGTVHMEAMVNVSCSGEVTFSEEEFIHED